MTTHLSQHTMDTAGLAWRTYAACGLEEALERWRHLERRIDNRSVACSATWTECWIRHYGDLLPVQILLAEARGEVRGMCLVTRGVGQKLGPLPLNTRHVGTAGEPQPGSACVEYNRTLVEPAYREGFVAGVMESIRNDLRWEQFRLDGFSEADLQPWLRHLPTPTVRYRDSRYFDLKKTRQTGEEVLARLGKSTRSNLRRLLKKYDRIECDWAESLEQAEEIFHELVELHQARWTSAGEGGAFASERFLSFQQDLVLRLFIEERGVLFRVRDGAKTVGCLMLLVDENRLLNYLSGFAPFEERPSPGLVTNYLCMEAALERGFDAYDFLVGETRYKDNLSTDVNQLCWLTWSRPTFKIRLIEALRQAKRVLTPAGRKPESPTTANVRNPIPDPEARP